MPIILLDSGPEPTSYSNLGGQGARTSLITVTTTYSFASGAPANLVNGSKTQDNTNSLKSLHSPNVGDYFRLNLTPMGPRRIEELSFFTGVDAVDNSDWLTEGSNDASSWTTLKASTQWTVGTCVFPLAGVPDSGFLYYQIRCTGGSGAFATWIEEFECKIGLVA